MRRSETKRETQTTAKAETNNADAATSTANRIEPEIRAKLKFDHPPTNPSQESKLREKT